MDKLINGEMTFDDYEEMFYQFAKPLKTFGSSWWRIGGLQ